jgi:hypothetical protein
LFSTLGFGTIAGYNMVSRFLLATGVELEK